MNVTLSAIRLLGTINRCLAIKGGDSKSNVSHVLRMMKLTVPNVIQNLPHIWFAIKKFIFRQIQFFRFSQSLVITSLSIKADIFSRRCRHLYNVSQEVVKYFAERWRVLREKVCVGFVYPNFFFRSAVVEVILCSGAEQGGCVCSPSASPSVGQRLPVVQQVAQISRKFYTWSDILATVQKVAQICSSRSHILATVQQVAQISSCNLISVTRLKDSNWWNEVSKSPITKAAHSSASLTAAPVEEIIIKVDIGLKEITIHNYEAQSWMCVRIPKNTP